MKLSILMYHYVRELRASRFPEIKGLEAEQFSEQIGYIQKHYNVIRGEDLLAAAAGGCLDSLPPAALLLTFDDGYIDHYQQVFPVLQREGLTGCFFPPARCILDRQVLDVNKIHFILASVPEKQAIVETIFRMLDANREQYRIAGNEEYWDRLAVPGRFDPKEVIFIKRILQRELPEALRQDIINGLFQKYVTADEAAFAEELYLSLDQIRCMRESGNTFGSHGYGHYWLNSIDPAQQKSEIDRSCAFLRQIGVPLDAWMMCYPYGAYDDSLLSILSEAGCKIGLTTRIAIADLSQENPLTLSRLDTNDLPKSADAPPNEWTLRANC